MADKKEEKDLTVPETVQKALQAVASTIGVAAGELWGIFVRQYLVRGLTEAFSGISLLVASYFLAPYIHLWILVPIALAHVFFYGAILLVGNPKYYAIGDITQRVSDFREHERKIGSRYY